MKERPILFSAAMVRALLSGTKTQTRRVVKPHVSEAAEYMAGGPDGEPATSDSTGFMFKTYSNDDGKECGPEWLVHSSEYPEEGVVPVGRCPYGQPGDRLWVRETHWMDRRDTTLAVMNVDGFVVAQNGRETGREANPEQLGLNHFWRLRPSIHMPRWASRILLEVTAVRVERLSEISNEDSIAEGVNVHPDHHGKPRGHICSPMSAYRDLWEQINGPGSWDANPWVWCISFRRINQ